MKVAITGGTGFVGRHLAQRLVAEGHEVVVPCLLALLPPRPRVARLAGCRALLLPLLVAFALPTGPLAVVCALPWLLLACVRAVSAVTHGFSQLPEILRPTHASQLGVDVALGFWAVGAVFIAVDRSGIATGFSPAIVLPTAVHFHGENTASAHRHGRWITRYQSPARYPGTVRPVPASLCIASVKFPA